MNPHETMKAMMAHLSRKDWGPARDLARMLKNYLKHHPEVTEVCGLSARGVTWTCSCVLVGVDLFTAE